MTPFPGPSPHIELRFSKHPAKEFGLHQLQRVAHGIEQEDMRPVSAIELGRSYAATAAVNVDGPNEGQFVGFARQVQRDMLTTRVGPLAVVEVGSVWVEPSNRGLGVGRSLIDNTTRLMNFVGFVPIAVCNQDSRGNFESAGYTPIGTMPPTAEGNDRILELYEDHIDPVVRKEWSNGLADEVLAGIGQLPRFAQMVLGPKPC